MNYIPVKNLTTRNTGIWSGIFSSTLLKAVNEFAIHSSVKNNVMLKNRIVLNGFLDRNLLSITISFLPIHTKSSLLMNQESATVALEYFQLEQLNTRYFAYTLEYKNFWITE
ncbi:MAG: hypothetical protein IPG02_05550 [Ignavibacteria bacterium]|nr:hypothetical protein [Ignavibacteria bacterium]